MDWTQGLLLVKKLIWKAVESFEFLTSHHDPYTDPCQESNSGHSGFTGDNEGYFILTLYPQWTYGNG